ncbi:hypothetical protein NUH88_04315 [Nisaea acidiphila]|uniref:Uncharacterized protein n=1 Tax=Nisaea acidiphila TaxID=1862145 RepID=A0A9J7AZP2_9PROT|nr:hypothetical protein [Nisaea acidiphila]UUX50917.1 hypothetical protein NUH88_04315 [Nisaea acidiphila]
MPARALPSQAEMRQRLGWIDRLVDQVSDGEGVTLSPQAAALFDEMRHCFAAGCWLAALVLAQAALDAELQQGEIDGLAQNEIRFGADYVWLRNRRNHLLHVDDPMPAVTLEDLERNTATLEQDARRAFELFLKAVT